MSRATTSSSCKGGVLTMSRQRPTTTLATRPSAIRASAVRTLRAYSPRVGCSVTRWSRMTAGGLIAGSGLEPTTWCMTAGPPGLKESTPTARSPVPSDVTT